MRMGKAVTCVEMSTSMKRDVLEEEEEVGSHQAQQGSRAALGRAESAASWKLGHYCSPRIQHLAVN